MRKIEALKKLAVNLGLIEVESDIESNDLGEVIDFIATNIINLPAKDGIILNSSTPESTKKFKITVSDDGTILATEVR